MAGPILLFGQVPAMFQQDGGIVFFSPYNCTVGVVQAQAATNLEALQNNIRKFGCFGIPSSEGPSLPQNFDLTLLVTNSCNLQCKYCFASAGEKNNGTMSFDLAKSVVDGIFDGINRANVKISFFGGEPTLRMPLIKKVVEHVRKLSRSTGKGYLLYITTNGVLSRKSLEYLVDNDFTFVISSDGHPDVQDLLRPMKGGGPSSKAVEKTIDFLVSQDVPFKVRSTISNQNVVSMEKNVRYFGDRGVKTIHFEPMTRAGRANSNKGYIDRPEENEYTTQFIAALNTAKENGISLISSSYMNFLAPSFKFCDAMAGSRFVVTWDGQITTCVEVQDFCHPFSEYATVGRVSPEDNQIEIDSQKYSDIIENVEVQQNQECKDCFAKYCCGGGCPVKAYYSCAKGTVDPYRCTITKVLVKEILNRILVESQTAGDIEYSSDALTLYSMHIPGELWMKRKRAKITQFLARMFVGS